MRSRAGFVAALFLVALIAAPSPAHGAPSPAHASSVDVGHSAVVANGALGALASPAESGPGHNRWPGLGVAALLGALGVATCAASRARRAPSAHAPLATVPVRYSGRAPPRH